MAKKTLSNQIENSTPTPITNVYTPTATSEIVTKFVIVIISILILWPTAIFVLDTAGVPKAEKTLAQTLTFAPLGLFIMYSLRLLVGDLVEKYLNHLQVQKQSDIEVTRIRYQMQLNIAATSQALGKEKLFQELLIAVLFEAYEHQHKHGVYTGIERPWSRRNAAKIRLVNNNLAGESLAKLVRPYLEDNAIIKNNQLNIVQYPDLASVKQFLNGPIILNANRLVDTTKQTWSLIG